MKKNKLVRHYMTRPVTTIRPSTPLSVVRHLVNETGIQRFPVVNTGRLVGIITMKDIRNKTEPVDPTALSLLGLHELLLHLTVVDVMTRNLVTVSQYDSVSWAAELMLEHEIEGLPVIDEFEQVVGVITKSDIFRLMIKQCL